MILEAGAGDFSVEWSLVQPDVARFVRACSYDRAGDGWIDWGGRAIPPVEPSNPLRIADIPPRTLDQMKEGLAEAVRRASEPPRTKLPVAAQRMRAWASGQFGHMAAAVNPFVEEELALLRAERENNVVRDIESSNKQCRLRRDALRHP